MALSIYIMTRVTRLVALEEAQALTGGLLASLALRSAYAVAGTFIFTMQRVTRLVAWGQETDVSKIPIFLRAD